MQFEIILTMEGITPETGNTIQVPPNICFSLLKESHKKCSKIWRTKSQSASPLPTHYIWPPHLYNIDCGWIKLKTCLFRVFHNFFHTCKYKATHTRWGLPTYPMRSCGVTVLSTPALPMIRRSPSMLSLSTTSTGLSQTTWHQGESQISLSWIKSSL